MKTFVDKKGNIIEPSDEIIINTKKGNLKGTIISLKEGKIKVKIGSKVKDLDYNTYKNLILIENISDAYSDNGHNINPILNELLNDTRKGEKRDDSIQLDEMFGKGISTISVNTPKAKFLYKKNKLIALIKEAKSLTRDYKELLPLTEQFNKMLKQLSDSKKKIK